MAISARVDSEICRWAPSAANTRFSCGVGRAVIVGAVDLKAPSFIARNSELQQNADTSLSCHHSKPSLQAITPSKTPQHSSIQDFCASDPPNWTYTLRQ